MKKKKKKKPRQTEADAVAEDWISRRIAREVVEPLENDGAKGAALFLYGVLPLPLPTDAVFLFNLIIINGIAPWTSFSCICFLPNLPEHASFF